MIPITKGSLMTNQHTILDLIKGLGSTTRRDVLDVTNIHQQLDENKSIPAETLAHIERNLEQKIIQLIGDEGHYRDQILNMLEKSQLIIRSHASA